MTEVNIQIPEKLMFFLTEKARYKVAFGGRGCVHGDTLIDTPNGSIKAKDFKGGAIYSFDGSNKIVAYGSPAVQYPVTDLYKVSLSSGKTITCTEDHKLLTTSGWLSVSQLSDDALIYPKLSFPLQTSSDNDLSGLLLDVQHCWGKLLNSLYCYFVDCRQYDLQLLPQLKTYQDVLPLLGDAQPHKSRALCHEDDLWNACMRNHGNLLSRLSSLAALLQGEDKSYTEVESQSDEKSFEPLLRFCQSLLQSHKRSIHPLPFQHIAVLLEGCETLIRQDEILERVFGILFCDVHDNPYSNSLHCCNHTHHTVNILEIQQVESDNYYDIFVPVYNNYISEDTIHHNSAKSHSVARALIIKAHEACRRILCTREIQASIADSVHKLLSDIIWDYGLGDYFTITQHSIKHKNGSEFIFKGLRNNINEVKSLEGIDICWVEEANKVSEASWDVLIPTIREDGSEIWATFNPDDELDAAYQRFIVNPPPNSIVRMVNYVDNPWFNETLRKEMEHDKATDIDKYKNIWLGELRSNLEGSYYRHQMNALKDRGGICDIMLEPNLPVYTAWDLGYSDYTAIWTFQIINNRIHVLWYDEACNETLNYYINILQERRVKFGFVYGTHFWPHDGNKNDVVFGNRMEKAIDLGLPVEIIPQTKSVLADIELCKNYFYRLYFNEATTKVGVRHVERYSREWNEKMNRYKDSPRHDDHSHGADGFRYVINACDGVLIDHYDDEEEYAHHRDGQNAITGY